MQSIQKISERIVRIGLISLSIGLACLFFEAWSGEKRWADPFISSLVKEFGTAFLIAGILSLTVERASKTEMVIQSEELSANVADAGLLAAYKDIINEATKNRIYSDLLRPTHVRTEMTIYWNFECNRLSEGRVRVTQRVECKQRKTAFSDSNLVKLDVDVDTPYVDSDSSLSGELIYVKIDQKEFTKGDLVQKRRRRDETAVRYSLEEYVNSPEYSLVIKEVTFRIDSYAESFYTKKICEDGLTVDIAWDNDDFVVIPMSTDGGEMPPKVNESRRKRYELKRPFLPGQGVVVFWKLGSPRSIESSNTQETA